MWNLVKRIKCKWSGKHEYKYSGTIVEGRRPYITKVHVRRCKTCGHYKRIAV